jgi:hypothetical protein
MSWKSLLARLAGLSLLVLALGLAVVPSTSAATPAVVASPGNSPAWFDFRATGFGRTEHVHYYLIGPDGQSIGGRDHSTNGNGDVNFNLKMPRWAYAGVWTITVIGEDSESQASGSFEMPQLGPDIELTVDRATGPLGTSFHFTSTGFDREETVQYWLIGPDGKVYLTGQVDASLRGHVAIDAPIGAGQPTGQWTLRAYGQDSDSLGVATVTVS